MRGRGVLDGWNFTVDPRGPALVSLPCVGALVEGVTLVNSPKYNIDTPYPYATARWVKAVSWAFSTDGWGGGAQGLLQDSFFMVNDDAVKLYGSGLVAERVVIWQQSNGCALMGSWNLPLPGAGFVRARQIDIMRSDRAGHYYEPDALICFFHGGRGALHHYLMDDIAVDGGGWAAVQVFVARNAFGEASAVLGSIANVIVRNFSSSAPFSAPRPLRIQGFGPASTVARVYLDGVYLGGVAAGPDLLAINVTFAQMPSFCQGCTHSMVGAEGWTEAERCGEVNSYCMENPPNRPPSGPGGGTISSSAAAAPPSSTFLFLCMFVVVSMSTSMIYEAYRLES